MYEKDLVATFKMAQRENTQVPQQFWSEIMECMHGAVIGNQRKLSEYKCL